MMYFLISICCISCVLLIILCFVLYQNIKELNYEKRQNLNRDRRTKFYEDEVQRLDKKLKAFEEKEAEALKSTPMKKEYNYEKLFEGKKAIVGNYSSFIANQTKEMLQNFGLSVEIVRTGTEVLEKVKNDGNYDIIFTNHIYQSGFDGVELLRMLKELDGFETPVVVHTISKDQRYHFMVSLGFDEYLEKPIQPEELERVLKKFLK